MAAHRHEARNGLGLRDLGKSQKNAMRKRRNVGLALTPQFGLTGKEQFGRVGACWATIQLTFNKHLNHLGIVAEVCREIGVAEWLDQQEPGNRQHVSVGTATVALVLNGLGFSNRRLYLVSQFFADKPVEHLLGPGITAEDLSDDCLGRALDWLYAHDPTTLFAGIALRARRRFGIRARQVHVDTGLLLQIGRQPLGRPDVTGGAGLAYCNFPFVN